jgi:hypothetical protein
VQHQLKNRPPDGWLGIECLVFGNLIASLNRTSVAELTLLPLIGSMSSMSQDLFQKESRPEMGAFRIGAALRYLQPLEARQSISVASC